MTSPDSVALKDMMVDPASTSKALCFPPAKDSEEANRYSCVDSAPQAIFPTESSVLETFSVFVSFKGAVLPGDTLCIRTCLRNRQNGHLG